jgi:hypothetical protein
MDEEAQLNVMARSQSGAARLAATLSLQTPCHGENGPRAYRIGLLEARRGLFGYFCV